MGGGREDREREGTIITGVREKEDEEEEEKRSGEAPVLEGIHTPP